MTESRTYEGGCHCGALRFRVAVRTHKVLACNCSICSKKGFLHLIVPQGDFELLAGEARLATYEFNTRVAKHHFCTRCGIHPFYRPRSHPEGVSVNARCLDDDGLEDFEIEPFDGRRWEENVASIRT
jgi:hypothetical protein